MSDFLFKFIIIFCFFGSLSHAEETSVSYHSPPLTVLPEKSGSIAITSDLLINNKSELLNDPVVKWVDNTSFVYTIKSLETEPQDYIYLYHTEAKKPEVLTKGRFPLPSPDGQWVAFLASNQQVWVMHTTTHELNQISHIQSGITGYYQFNFNYAWSPDSQEMLLSYQAPSYPWENTPQPSILELININKKEERMLTSLDAMVENLSWIPGAREILFVKERKSGYYHEFNSSASIVAFNVDTQEERTLVKFNGLQQRLAPIPSKEGKNIAFMYDPDHPFFDMISDIGIIPTAANVATNPLFIQRVTREAKVVGLEWDGESSFLALRAYGAYRQIYKVDGTTGNFEQLTHEPLSVEAYDLSPDGTHLAWMGTNAHGTTVVQWLVTEGSRVHTVFEQPAVSQEIKLSEVREIAWETIDYPTVMRGLLILPLNYDPKQAYPLIVDIHGGDSGATLLLLGGILVKTPLEWQWWAAKGYAVFVPEFRSSGTVGSVGIDRDFLKDHDRFGGDLKDIESGIDYLVQMGIVDPDRMAIFGHSAGARRANWFAVSTHRYKAIVSYEGSADNDLELALNEPSETMYAMDGDPREVPENYLKNSALHFADQATTPTLFLMGNPQLGGIDPYFSVRKFYESMKNNGVETSYIEYLDEGHGLEKKNNAQDALHRIAKWIDDHLAKEHSN